jgi:hypothetical protein
MFIKHKVHLTEQNRTKNIRDCRNNTVTSLLFVLFVLPEVRHPVWRIPVMNSTQHTV